jgi:alkanesulfonate monooxygenase SsuD/methylene tetrahydromethanopterin reductase-like flavin-dependent oxidoreductase (luciferase family)
MAFATMSELSSGREISLGLGPGSRSILTRHVVRAKPLTVMAELASALRTLFAGQTLHRQDIPVLAEYFHLNAAQYALRFKAAAPIHLYYGPSLLKPAVLDLVAQHFDGVILQTLYGMEEMRESLERLERARIQSGVSEPLRKTMLINASIGRDGEAARQHAKRFVSHIVSGWPDQVLEAKGIDPKAIQAVRLAYAENRGVDAAAALTPDHAVDRLIIAGTAAQCRERLADLFTLAATHRFNEIVIGVPLGPEIAHVIELWGTEILPGMR